MIIESLSARHGDATLVRHTGESGDLVGLVDGGPNGVFKETIAGALESLGITPDKGALAWVAVSHVDSDHIGGVIELVNADFKFGTFLFNTPHVFPNVGVATASTGGLGLTQVEQSIRTSLDRVPLDVTPASIAEGNRLLNLLLAKSWRSDALNSPLQRRLLTGDTLDIGGLKLTVLGPSEARIKKLLAKWSDAPTTASAQAVDASVTNLSSLTFLAEANGQTALFTGDALEDDVVAGLTEVGRALPMDVDLLKLPHHGSNSAARKKSVTAGKGLIENVRASNYIVSADGKFTNPSPETLNRISALGSACTVWFPAPVSNTGSADDDYYKTTLDAFQAQIKASRSPVTVKIGTGKPLVIDLS